MKPLLFCLPKRISLGCGNRSEVADIETGTGTRGFDQSIPRFQRFEKRRHYSSIRGAEAVVESNQLRPRLARSTWRQSVPG
jgi:hypothetical protein